MNLAKEITRIVKGKIKFNEPLSKHTSLRIGGPADYWVEPKDLEDLRVILEFALDRHLPWKVLGEGTNILARDRGFRGLIISLRGDCFQKLEFNEEKVAAGAGVLLSKLTSEAGERGLGGLEFAVGIPGTVGGGVVTNAGAQSVSVGDVTSSVKVLNPSRGISLLKKEDLKFDYGETVPFGYRTCNLGKDEVVLEAEMEFKKEDKDEIANLMKEHSRKRKETQPLREASAGCIFKNPSHVSAGELIDKAGLKGRRVGDAQVSTKHANFIINRGGAKAEEVFSLMETVREEVLRKMGIRLEPEIEII